MIAACGRLGAKCLDATGQISGAGGSLRSSDQTRAPFARHNLLASSTRVVAVRIEQTPTLPGEYAGPAECESSQERDCDSFPYSSLADVRRQVRDWLLACDQAIQTKGVELQNGFR